MEDMVMLAFVRLFYGLLLIATFLFPQPTFAEDSSINIPILVYHNFNPTVPGSMNLTPQKLEQQIKWLKDNGYNIVPLKEVVEYLQGKRPSLPPKSVVITADDGWESVYTYMYPIVKKYNIPVTLFIYPSTISVGKHAMTWEQLKELQNTGLFDIEDHTYWHPDFIQEKKRLSQTQYEKFVKVQLVNSKRILENKLGIKVTLLAWPYGIYDDYLEQEAQKAGYVMAFSIDDHTANRSYHRMAQPRFMIMEKRSMKTFANIVNSANAKEHVASAKNNDKEITQ